MGCRTLHAGAGKTALGSAEISATRIKQSRTMRGSPLGAGDRNSAAGSRQPFAARPSLGRCAD